MKIAAKKRALLWCALPLCASATQADAQDRVGVTSAVNPSTTGQPPAAAQRVLLLGQEVVRNETVRTLADGQAQLLFLDKSSFSVGPNSEVVIDEFVYSPATGLGRLAATATKGVFRYVGGALSKSEGAVSLKTPATTIGIRGGIVLLDVSAGQTTAVLLFGNAMTIDAPGGSQTVRRAGFGVTVGANGIPGAPFPASNTQLQGFVRQLDGRPGASGGAPIPPTNAAIVQSGVPQANAQNVVRANEDAVRGQQVAAPPPVFVASLSNQSDIQSVQPAAEPTPSNASAPTPPATVAPSPPPSASPTPSPSVPLEPTPAPDPLANLPAPPSEPYPALRSALLADSRIFSFIPDGALTSIANLPTSGFVTYQANIIAAINIGGVTTIPTSGGCFVQTWDFGCQIGSVMLSTPPIGNQQFSFSGTITTAGAANAFQGTLSPTNNTGSANVAGKFYDNASGQAAGQSAGTFNGATSGPVASTFTGNFKSFSRTP